MDQRLIVPIGVETPRRLTVRDEKEYFDDIQDVKVTKDISPSHFSLPRYGRRVGLHITCLLGKLPSGS